MAGRGVIFPSNGPFESLEFLALEYRYCFLEGVFFYIGFEGGDYLKRA